MHIVLLGDSIFDNASYVRESESVSDLLKNRFPNSTVSLLAVDGDITTDVHEQLKSFPESATAVFLSCGGNDALRSIDILDAESSSVGEALDILFQVKERFRSKYIAMLDAVLSQHENIAVCTIYNKVPGLSESAYTALALFNEVILEELSSRKLPIIDLRVICNEERDYSTTSPIEPSLHGGKKIVQRMADIVESGYLSGVYI